MADSTDDESTRNESAGPGTHAHAPTAQRHDGSDPSGGRVSSILKVPPVVVALTSLSCDAPAAGEGCMVCCCEARAVACESVLSRSSRAAICCRRNPHSLAWTAAVGPPWVPSCTLSAPESQTTALFRGFSNSRPEVRLTIPPTHPSALLIHAWPAIAVQLDAHPRTAASKLRQSTSS